MTLQEMKKKNVWKVLFQVLNSDASAFLHMIKKGQNTHFFKTTDLYGEDGVG